ncbi:MAG: hypothetical protein IGS03_13270 [Candidatus Sericytochromatia bacterium]|nr:hypothetical protein [Candidatus Sericytochromatia bacterium]
MPHTVSVQRWHWITSAGLSVLGLGLMLYCLQAPEAWIPMLDPSAGSTYIVYEESAGTSWQVKVAFLLALFLITPVCFVFSGLPFIQGSPKVVKGHKINLTNPHFSQGCAHIGRRVYFGSFY